MSEPNHLYRGLVRKRSVPRSHPGSKNSGSNEQTTKKAKIYKHINIEALKREAKEKLNFLKVLLLDFKEISERKMKKLLKSCKTLRLERLLYLRLLQVMTKKCALGNKQAMYS